jgi:hypothetical protein
MRAITSPNYSVLGAMGDVHGDTEWTIKAIDRFAEIGCTHILQMGDFGVWPGPSGASFVRKVNARLKLRGMLMVVTLGNHEDYARLESKLQPAQLGEGFDQLPSYDHILFARRGQRWSWDGVDFCSLGGANSIDRYSRTPFVSWWPQESISLGDVYRTVEGGTADIMLTHDCPEGVPIVQELSHHSEGAGWSSEALAYAQESRVMLRQAVDMVQPELLLHGHYHVKADLQVELGVLGTDDSYSMRSVCLDKEWTDGNMLVLEPSTRKLTSYADWTRA